MATRRPSGLPPNLKMVRDDLESLRSQIEELTELEILVGFPEETTGREASEDEPEGITNAALGYIHDNGEPERNIPARPFMIPAMQEVEGRVTEALTQTARRVLLARGKRKVDVAVYFERIGSIVELAIKNKINEGIPPPLSDATLRARAARGRMGAMWELAWRAAGAPPGVDGLAKPLVDTAQMRNSVRYVVRRRRRT